MVIAYYISGHGFGHASRSTEVIKAILKRAPAARIVVRTSAPRWFIEFAVGGTVEIETVSTDTGVIQADSLHVDIAETARAARTFYSTFCAGVRQVSDPCLTPDLVVGDIPPLAFAAAASAGVPSVAVANFTWDWIYAGYEDFDALAPGVIEVIRQAYTHTTLALRLPFPGGFEPMAAVTRDIPLVARRARRAPADTRRALGIDGDRPVVLASFGGHGLRLAYDQIAAQGGFSMIVTDHETRNGGPRTRGYVPVTYQQLTALDLKYEDLVAAADVVVSKPGYGIVAECIANDTALLYTLRAPFVEQDVLVREMPRYMRCREIALADLVEGRWSDAIDAVLRLPAPRERVTTDGAAIAADAIIDLLYSPRV